MNEEKYYGYLYEIIIPMSDGEKHYYGKKEYDHRCKQCTGIYKSYWGSGIIIKDWFLAHTNNNYTSRNCPEKIAFDLGIKRIIHGFYKTKEDLDLAEKQLIELHLGKDYCINLAKGGTGGDTGHYVCTDETRKKRSIIHKGTKMWTNGLINKKSKECPGDGWKRGLTLSQKEINRRKNYKPSNIKKVYCVELNLLFYSISAVKKYFDINNHHRTCYVHIYRCCEDHKLTWQGYHWKYIEDVDNQELSYIDVNGDRVNTVKIKFQKTKMPSNYLMKGTQDDFEKAVELAKQD